MGKVEEIKKSRPSINEYFMALAEIVSRRSTCRHRDQGTVLVKDNRLITTGYNGSPPKQPHCIEIGYCAKAEGLSCRAEGLHGESNAIASAALLGVSTKGATAYCIYSPCLVCCNLLKSAGVVKVIYQHVYAGFPEGPDYLSRTLRIEVEKYDRKPD